MMAPQTAPLVYFFVVLPTETYNLVGLRHKNEQCIHSDGLFFFTKNEELQMYFPQYAVVICLFPMV